MRSLLNYWPNFSECDPLKLSMKIQTSALTLLSATLAHHWWILTVICLMSQSELSAGWHKWWADRSGTITHQVIHIVECTGRARKGGVQDFLLIFLRSIRVHCLSAVFSISACVIQQSLSEKETFGPSHWGMLDFPNDPRVDYLLNQPIKQQTKEIKKYKKILGVHNLRQPFQVCEALIFYKSQWKCSWTKV